MRFEDFFTDVRRAVNKIDHHDFAADEVARAMRKMTPRLADMWRQGEDPGTGAVFVVAEMEMEE